MTNLVSVLEKKTYKLLWDFEIQTDRLISTRLPNLMKVKKKKKKKKKKKTTRWLVDFVVPIDHRIKLKESEKRDKHRDFAEELKILLYSLQKIGTMTEGLGNKRTSRNIALFLPVRGCNDSLY